MAAVRKHHDSGSECRPAAYPARAAQQIDAVRHRDLAIAHQGAKSGWSCNNPQGGECSLMLNSNAQGADSSSMVYPRAGIVIRRGAQSLTMLSLHERISFRCMLSQGCRRTLSSWDAWEIH